MPAFQKTDCGTVANVNACNGKRGTPDLAWVGDPATGVSIVNGTSWYIAGGTSLSAPSVAGAIADANAAKGVTLTTSMVQTRITASGTTALNHAVKGINDVTIGGNGSVCCKAGVGYDLTTGVGSLNVDAWIAGM